MFSFFRRKPGQPLIKWSVINDRAQIGDRSAHLGFVDTKTYREAKREAKLKWPGMSLDISRVSPGELTEGNAGFD